MEVTRSGKEDAESINRYIEDQKIGVVKVKNVALVTRVSLSKMIDLLAEYGVESNLEYEAYLKGLKTLRKQWP